jgi:hypothetical protein
VLAAACGHLAAPTGTGGGGGGGTPAALSFTTQPLTTAAGQDLPALQIEVKDAAGKAVTNFNGAVTVAFAVNPGSDTLDGTTTVNAVAGVATFANLIIDRAASGYRLIATSGQLAPATSGRFDILGGAATQLVFTAQPSASVAGKSFSPAVRLSAVDSLGNLDATFIGTVTVAIAHNPAGGTLSGGTAQVAAAGVATFATLSLDKVGSGYTLSATAVGLKGATSVAFDVTAGSATHLIFSVQPSSMTAGATITPSVQVTALDTAGNPATGYIGNVSLSITGGTGTPGASLSGVRTIAAVAGIATFSGLSIDLAGTAYTLTATGSGTTGTISQPFNVAAAAADSLVFTTQPTATTAGMAINPAVQVSARDSLGNVVSGYTGTVTVALAPGTGTPGAHLLGTKAVAAVAGVATFSTLKIDSSGTGYRFTAAAAGISGTTSASFTITAGTATRLSFTVQPTTTAAGKTISPSVRVAAVDALGNTDPTFSGTVTVAIGHNPSGGTLSGTVTVAAFGGVATFSTLSIDKVGTGYTLTAAAAGLTGVTSTSFDIGSGAATQLLVTVQPHSATAGGTITPAVQVAALDAGGNPAASFVGNVSVAITAGTGTAGASLGGTRTVAAVAGVAVFSTLSINLAGTGYTLTATSSGLTPAISNAFNITAAAADSLVFTTQPIATTAGQAVSPAVQVAARDSLGNVVTSFTGNVTVAIAPGTGTPGAHLTGTTTLAAVAGVATFSTLKIDSAGSGYRFTASASGVSGTTSASFVITAGTATRLLFAVQPTTAPSGKMISPSVKVTATDALGNTNATFSGNVTVAIGHNPSGGTLSGTVTVAAFGGVATFSTLSIDKAGTGYTLTAAATGLTGTTSAPFAITAGSATQLVVSVQPHNAVAGVAIAPAVQVTALDVAGNPATGFIGNVTVTITANTGTAGATLSGTRTVAATAGVASFSTLSIDLAGTGYTLTASASGLASTVSGSFNITPAAAAALFFTVQPTTTTAGATITPAVQVTARDAFGNTATGFTGMVTIAIGTDPSGGVLSGTTTVNASAGIASFSTLSINLAGTGYTLTANASGVTGATSTAFNTQ